MTKPTAEIEEMAEQIAQRLPLRAQRIMTHRDCDEIAKALYDAGYGKRDSAALPTQHAEEASVVTAPGGPLPEKSPTPTSSSFFTEYDEAQLADAIIALTASPEQGG